MIKSIKKYNFTGADKSFRLQRMASAGGKYNSGFMLLEIIIAITLISIVFVTLLGIGVLVINVSSSIQKETQADFLTKEEFEAVRSFRDGTTWSTDGLGAVNLGNPYHLVNNSNAWALIPGAEITGIFTRQIVFGRVLRDVNGDINSIGSVLDPDTVKVTITVSWQGKTSTTVSYLTNWKNE